MGEVGVKERVKSVLNYKRSAFWLVAVAIAGCMIVAICFLTNPSDEYQIRITIPAGSTERFCYSEEEICPKRNKLRIASGEGLGDTEVLLKPIEVNEESSYDTYGPTYMTPGMPVNMDVEKHAWFKIGVNMQNSTAEDIHVYVTVRNVEVRIASEEGVNESDFDGTDRNQENALIHPEALEEDADLQDLAYYLELSVSDMKFKDMSGTKKTQILEEYETLLDEYTLIARESTDGKASYIIGHYNGDVTAGSLYKMYDMGYTSDKYYQILYMENNQEELDRVIDEQGVQAIKDEGYVIENSWMYRSESSDYIFIQPIDSRQKLNSTFSLYVDDTRGRQYIEDAISRGIALNDVEGPCLSVYMISEKYGEITEKIPLTKETASEILTEETQKLSDGLGFGATLEINGDSYYYSEKKVPQTVLDLAVEKCGYQFTSPDDITDSITEARFDCSWLEEPLYLDASYMSRLEEILKTATFEGVGNCGYGARLTLTLENGETMTIFKGMDDCGSLVFGSWGGYTISKEADKEFWEMFGLRADDHTKLISSDQYSEEMKDMQKEVMRVVSRVGLTNAYSWDEAAELKEDTDALVRMAIDETGRYEIYGIMSAKYGTYGLLLNDWIGEEENWNFAYVPWICAKDQKPILEPDGKGKYIFAYVYKYDDVPLWHEYMLDCGYETGHMELLSDIK